jgi:hypothetical protein
MPDQSSATSPKDEDSSSWKLIRENLARREFAPAGVVKVEKVTSEIDGKVEVSGKDASGASVQREVEPDAAFQRIESAAAQTSRQIQELYAEAKRQATTWFWASVAAAVLGFALVGIGFVAIWLYQQGIAAVFSATCGVFLEVIAGLFFSQSKEANKRVDEYRTDLVEAQKFNQAIDLCRTITDPDAKMQQIGVIIEKLLDTAMGEKPK